MAVRAYLALFFSLVIYPLGGHTLESLDDARMSNVVAQEGVVLRAEYEVAIDNIQLFDEDDFGTISMTDVNIATRAQQIIDIDIVSGAALGIAHRTGRNGVRFTNKELPIDFSVDIVRINGKSLGGFGMTNLTTGYKTVADKPLIVDIWAGGYKAKVLDSGGQEIPYVANESGFTVDISVPMKSSYDLYYEEDGTRLGMTVDYCSSGASAATCTVGGLEVKGLTFDVTAKGLRLGIPEITGQVNIRNFKIANSVINDITLKNFNIKPGGYVNIGAPDAANKSSIEFDAYVASGTGFDFEFYDTSGSDVQQMNATIGFNGLASKTAPSNAEKDFFYIKDSSINMRDGADEGVFIALGGIRGSISASDIILKPKTATGTVPTLGSIKMNLQVMPNSYLEVMGH